MRFIISVGFTVICLTCKPRQNTSHVSTDKKVSSESEDAIYMQYLADCEKAVGKPPKLDCFAKNTVEIPSDKVMGDEGEKICARPMLANLFGQEPQLSHCNAGSRIGRWTLGDTEWVLVCRKEEGKNFYELNVIAYEKTKQATCFYQTSTHDDSPYYHKFPGENLPGFADTTFWHNFKKYSLADEADNTMYCTACHQSKPFLVTPWVASAKDADGKQIVPSIAGSKLWIPTDAFFKTGYQRGFRLKEKEKKQNKCQTCHEIGHGPYASFLVPAALGFDEYFSRSPARSDWRGIWNKITSERKENFQTFYWMPSSSASRMKAHDYNNADDLWKDYGSSLRRIMDCSNVFYRKTEFEDCWEPNLYFGKNKPILAPDPTEKNPTLKKFREIRYLYPN